MNARAILVSVLLSFARLDAQMMMASVAPGERGELLSTDSAVLDQGEKAKSLPCVVKQTRPELGFDLAFHAGYSLHLRLRDLAGDGDVLTTIFRVIPNGDHNRAVYFQQKWRVPSIRKDAYGNATLSGAFTVGEGDYRVDWLVRDGRKRYCSEHWSISARLPAKKRQPVGRLTSSTTLATASQFYPDKETLTGATEKRLRISILLNVAPQLMGAVSIPPEESDALVSILRGIAKQPRVNTFSITAFNLDQCRILYQEEDVQYSDFAALNAAIDSLNLGTVDVNELTDSKTKVQFLVELATEQAERTHPDALIFIGPKAVDERPENRDTLEQSGSVGAPVFYISYNAVPGSHHWYDVIGSAVKYWRGRELTVNTPADLIAVWDQIMSQCGRQAAWQRTQEK
jgi:hypothetical protein